MSASVETVRRYQAVCLVCAWWDMEVETEEAAEDAALEHNEEEHS